MPETPQDQKLAKLRDAVESLDWQRHDETIVLCEQVLRVEPGCPEAFYLLGLVSLDLDDPARAIHLLQRAHDSNPDFMEAAEALAAIHARLGRVQESLYFAKLGTISQPHPQLEGLLPARLGSFFQNLDTARPDLYLTRARRAFSGGDLEKALTDCETQLKLDGGTPETLRLTARVCRASGQSARALAAGHAVLHGVDPDAGDLGELAQALDLAGRRSEAEACHRAAVARAPGKEPLMSGLIDHLVCRPDIGLNRIAAAARDWRDRFGGRDLRPLAQRPPWGGERPLRIGYVGGCFRDHDLMAFFEPILKRHDPARVQAYCYANSSRSDVTTERLMRSAAGWTDIDRIDDETVWQILQGDEIDIAVDLSGHAPGGRPLLFARRPAPVSISWLGAFHPPAVAEIDHFLTDAVAWPQSAKHKASEPSPLAIDGGHLAFQPFGLLPEVGVPPASLQGHVTFGLQGDLRYIDTELLEPWAEIISALPGSRLLICNLENHDDVAMNRVLEALSHLGLRQRCDIVKAGDNFRNPYEFYGHIDIAIGSPAPEAAIEVCRSLWMGVPILVIKGQRHGTRLAASLLHHAGRTAWAAEDRNSLIEEALRLAWDRAGLAQIRETLRGESTASTLGDLAGRTRQLESAFEALYGEWERRQSGPRS